jgi:aspartyl-tRNA(Asn)/glutamyl-tRNA(Gln) amidotransferase subunit A
MASFKGVRIGFWSTPPCGTVDPEIAATIKEAVRQLESLGAIVEPVDLPGVDILETFNVLWYSGAAARLAPLSPEARGHVDPHLVDLAAAGEQFSAVRYVQAMAARAEFGLAMDDLLARFDILVSPSTTIPAFAVGHDVPPDSGLHRWIEWAGFSFPINLSQQPACTVPCGQTKSGLPIGLQLVGARGTDSAVLSYAAEFERTFPAQFL